nr:hypothetical protein [Candidatus Sigynarchaeota archaeon]
SYAPLEEFIGSFHASRTFFNASDINNRNAKKLLRRESTFKRRIHPIELARDAVERTRVLGTGGRAPRVLFRRGRFKGRS